MLFNKDLLFVHTPKTGGLSTTGYLLDNLPRPVYLTHPIWDASLPARGVVQIDGTRHETLAEARDIAARHGFALERFPLVLATIRNPYDLEVSRWAYLRQGHIWERGPEQDLALASSFEEFAVRNEQRGGGWATGSLAAYDRAAAAADGDGDGNEDGGGKRSELKDFYMLDGRIPENLRMLRFERLADDLASALADVGVDAHPGGFPWINRSTRQDYPSYYTDRAEKAVYRRYHWVFDRGLYPRLNPNPTPDPDRLLLAAGRVQAAEAGGRV